ncbi:MAG: TetR/AcrR family transcriptional regulator, partial [Alphaproteobacteria bacterium]|nr:TetR/AcrR family transcriptional regulator [Alphaproteobacteria bacterium]
MLERKATSKTQVDGRRARGADNRQRIVDALLKLVEGGSVSPNAEQVAAEAGVGLRTVFRHFADMESLRREISERMTAEIQPIIDQPFESDIWVEKLAELIERRVQAFERLLPFKIAGDAHRHRSAYLTAEQGMLVKTQRAALRGVLPAKIAEDKPRFEALDLLLSFEAWRRLRRDQGLSVRDTRAAMRLAADALTSS